MECDRGTWVGERIHDRRRRSRSPTEVLERRKEKMGNGEEADGRGGEKGNDAVRRHKERKRRSGVRTRGCGRP